MALLNRGHRREIEQTVSRIEKIETALEPNFQQHFVYAMALPNKVDPFPKLVAAGEVAAAKGDRRRTALPQTPHRAAAHARNARHGAAAGLTIPCDGLHRCVQMFPDGPSLK